jgi:hypothetical protein
VCCHVFLAIVITLTTVTSFLWLFWQRDKRIFKIPSAFELTELCLVLRCVKLNWHLPDVASFLGRTSPTPILCICIFNFISCLLLCFATAAYGGFYCIYFSMFPPSLLTFLGFHLCTSYKLYAFNFLFSMVVRHFFPYFAHKIIDGFQKDICSHFYLFIMC